MQYRDYESDVRVTDNEIVLRSQIGSITLQDIITRGGSEETDYKAAAWSHLQTVLANAPSASTSSPCSVVTKGKLNKFTASASFSTAITTLIVPTGNDGDIQFRIDPGSYTLTYQKNGGSATSLADEDIVTFADGDTLNLNISGTTEQDLFSGYLVDVETGQTIDNFQLMNTTPTP